MAVNPNTANLIDSFPDDFKIIKNLCNTLHSIAVAAVAKRKSEFYFESFYAIQEQLFQAWLNILGQAAFTLLTGPNQSAPALEQHHFGASSVSKIRLRIQAHQANFNKQKQGVPLEPPNFDFFDDMGEIAELLSSFVAGLDWC
jgi:hypothetical protein